MPLPNPLPDNPLRWDGWKSYNSPNFYERLCLGFDSNANEEQIEDNCRQLLVWWQKKLPLKNQPSNPLAQLLRAGLDEAPVLLAEARTELLNAESRALIDAGLHAEAVLRAIEEFKKILAFALIDKKLTPEAEERLYVAGTDLGLSREEMAGVVNAELERIGGERALPSAIAAFAPLTAAAASAAHASSDPSEEFRRMLRLSKLCLDGDDMTDDQRDAMCNMGESLGLTGGQAEDLIDEYLEHASNQPMQLKPEPTMRGAPSAPKTSAAFAPLKTAPPQKPMVTAATINISPVARTQEKLRYPNYENSIGGEMLLITSGAFQLGSDSPDASHNEQPITSVTIGCFYLAKYPITNEQYEKFDPTHRMRRPTWADEQHPVVFASSREAERFCQWLSQREGRKYRLPTEAEWEYAARGSDGRIFPWGQKLDAGHYANFADRRTNFPWRDLVIDDGFAESSPVDAFPRGASPFGIEDMSGNVGEWCLDFFETYRGVPRVNRRGPTQGARRVYRGGSWKSRASNVRASARHSEPADYSGNDVGFRIACICE